MAAPPPGHELQQHHLVLDRVSFNTFWPLINQHPYPITETIFMEGGGNVWFLHNWLDVSNHFNYRLWDDSKNTYPCGNHPFSNKVRHQGLKSDLMLSRHWWCILLGNVQFPHGYRFLLNCSFLKLDGHICISLVHCFWFVVVGLSLFTCFFLLLILLLDISPPTPSAKLGMYICLQYLHKL